MSVGSPSQDPIAGAARHGIVRTMLTTWTKSDWLEAGALLGFIALMHAVAFAVLFGIVGPGHYRAGTKVFGVGLGITAYTYGLRHAFDADHIAAIDNTTRKLRGKNLRPKVGFWFAMGHSTIVAGMAALVAAGAHVVHDLTTDGTTANQTLGLIGTTVSGAFLYLIAALNLVALIGIVRVFAKMRSGELDKGKLEAHLESRGFMYRILGRLTKTIIRPGQMYPVGVRFGLGFHTATEVALLVLAGAGAASGLPWYAIMVLPLLFASGMSPLDTLDGLFMSIAYDWAFVKPVRKIYYNISITGLSVAVAFLIGSIELISVLHDNLGVVNPITSWVSSINLNYVGFIIVGMFVATWTIALLYWRLADVEDRWSGAINANISSVEIVGLGTAGPVRPSHHPSRIRSRHGKGSWSRRRRRCLQGHADHSVRASDHELLSAARPRRRRRHVAATVDRPIAGPARGGRPKPLGSSTSRLRLAAYRCRDPRLDRHRPDGDAAASPAFCRRDPGRRLPAVFAIGARAVNRCDRALP